jgi:hypothetical protein
MGMALFTTALGLYGGVLWSGELQGPIIRGMGPALAGLHNAANEHLGPIERAESGAPRACTNQLGRPLEFPLGSPEAGGGG